MRPYTTKEQNQYDWHPSFLYFNLPSRGPINSIYKTAKKMRSEKAIKPVSQSNACLEHCVVTHWWTLQFCIRSGRKQKNSATGLVLLWWKKKKSRARKGLPLFNDFSRVACACMCTHHTHTQTHTNTSREREEKEHKKERSLRVSTGSKRVVNFRW